MPYLYLALISFVFLLILFWFAKEANKASLVDVYWTMGVPLLGLSAYFMEPLQNSRKTLLLFFVLLWAFRLLALLVHRMTLDYSENPHYVKVMAHWKGKLWTHVFFRFFLLEGLYQYAIALVIIRVMLTSATSLGAIDGIAIALFVTGFIFEIFADLQLIYFKRQNPGRICNIGLWSISRHPNYFGECLVWLSFYLFALSTPLGWAYFFSPLLVAFRLFIFHIPEIERHHKDDPEYQVYKKETHLFFPLWHRKLK
ncbi:MAG: hypothetical protein A3F09_01575 [Chlamydiae bacterium RIFCSPHIGHO2_12_FULL_49_11]|nr:MAG: hypothetical protein A3F09_01575 [Chlamydiae bacterium RIFCSPHIGHO2_12_FULL_49_11]